MKKPNLFSSFNKAMNHSIETKEETYFEEKLLNYEDFSIIWNIKLWKKWNQEYFINTTFNKKSLSFLEKISFKYIYFDWDSRKEFEDWKKEIIKSFDNIDLIRYWFKKQCLDSSLEDMDLFDSNDVNLDVRIKEIDKEIYESNLNKISLFFNDRLWMMPSYLEEVAKELSFNLNIVKDEWFEFKGLSNSISENFFHKVSNLVNLSDIIKWVDIKSIYKRFEFVPDFIQILSKTIKDIYLYPCFSNRVKFGLFILYKEVGISESIRYLNFNVNSLWLEKVEVSFRDSTWLADTSEKVYNFISSLNFKIDISCMIDDLKRLWFDSEKTDSIENIQLIKKINNWKNKNEFIELELKLKNNDNSFIIHNKSLKSYIILSNFTNLNNLIYLIKILTINEKIKKINYQSVVNILKWKGFSFTEKKISNLELEISYKKIKFLFNKAELSSITFKQWILEPLFFNVYIESEEDFENMFNILLSN